MTYLLIRGINKHGKAFKILFPSGSIPCSEENTRKYPEAKKKNKRGQNKLIKAKTFKKTCIEIS